MNNSSITLNHFFHFEAQNLPQDQMAGLESCEEIAALRQNLSETVRGISWSVAFDGIIRGVREFLDVKLEDVLAEAWKKTRELSKYRDPGTYGPNEIILVHLVEHTINSELHPALEVLVNDLVIQKIDFVIKLALNFKGLILKIKGGNIKEILPGSCKGRASLACGKFVLLEEETRTFTLPQSISLGEGIPL